MISKIVPVILAGGQGTRLWPMSRANRPKQFIELMGNRSLFQQTLERLGGSERYDAPIVVTNAEYRFVVAEQVQEAGVALGTILLEPAARNTAVAIASAAYYALDRDENAVLHILASDHAITADAAYYDAVNLADAAARDGWLVAFGIMPTRPDTGYGYIAVGDALINGASKVGRFVEKPDLAKAEAFLAEGGYVWNSGMFMIAAKTFIAECEALAPETAGAARGAVDLAKADLDFVRLDAAAFETAPRISVDYAIFEKTERAAVLPVSFDWSDLGSWDAVWAAQHPDASGNVVLGPALLSNTTNAMVMTTGAHVVIDGLDDIAVIASEDAIFVGRQSQAQRVGALVKQLKADPATRALTETHQTSYRPWGGYTSVLMADRFQVKRLFVKPGKKLSLQKHYHRSEHWVVVKGTAEVTIDGQVSVLTENQSIYLPLGCTHRLANPGKIQLELIEVQTGAYLGEDDIVRTEDDFGRAG
ncbi:mannose-1-phosphate guanylyltransferase/mannose-6-phosphate isomerase [Devosia neptuniae]|uniref:mannose-1-phosphate guanylyltransferase/mannose-6-phosphate isomerase n=1 Tax=Devosia neptuniae TaxID=191302 RepID=UPI0022AEC578|nr:mannose-1-phosphate guanylyltransferase/mannose-6-phosphate isomerase [Devosia neptuniae]MCZ4347996.1 mannose-1-phosphate guanylyltransferase/mannose-6-phosphate isomerase [Devosia neptuniae]|tara:strand:+ start:2205 stop:3632 length:1428 start_codon:yes stop_codon:yes gene_type:complete